MKLFAPAEWPAFLDRSCADLELRRQLERLLIAHQRRQCWLDRTDSAGRRHLGTLGGNDRLPEELGEHGSRRHSSANVAESSVARQQP